jgi:hypothetical protein
MAASICLKKKRQIGAEKAPMNILSKRSPIAAYSKAIKAMGI